MEELTLHRLEVLFIIIPIMLPVVFQLLEYEMRCRGSGVRGGDRGGGNSLPGTAAEARVEGSLTSARAQIPRARELAPSPPPAALLPSAMSPAAK